MSNFWQSGTGDPVNGMAKDAFIPDFTLIPDGTQACAKIQSFELVEKDNPKFGRQQYYEIRWKLTNGEFVNREVSQKIKCFSGKPEQIQRNLNMLKLIMNLCQFTMTHNNAPTNIELARMNNKILGIVIREWSQPKEDGSGIAEGNFVAEVWPSDSTFVTKTGVKQVHEVTSSHLDSAFRRNAQPEDPNDPFAMI